MNRRSFLRSAAAFAASAALPVPGVGQPLAFQRLDSLEPERFRYRITSRELA